jgi:hypothetical protein
MLFGTSTDFYSSLGAVSGSIFNDTWPYLVLVIGVPLAFFIVEMLVNLIPQKRDPVIERAEKIRADFDRLDWEGKKK